MVIQLGVHHHNLLNHFLLVSFNQRLSHLSKNGESAVKILVDKVKLIQVWVVASLDSFSQALGILNQHLLEADLCLDRCVEVDIVFLFLLGEFFLVIRMNELTSVTVRTGSSLLECLA